VGNLQALARDRNPNSFRQAPAFLKVMHERQR
jgi:hypothetical protein